MKLASVVRLSQGLAVQLICYAGLFLSLAVAARALSPAEFGIYASAVAIASFAGSVVTFGLDRILLRVLLQSEGSQTGAPTTIHAPLDCALFAPAAALNATLVLGAGTLAATGWLSANSLFIAIMAVLVASRLVLSGWFKFVVNNHANVIATFGLQSLAVALILGAVMVVAPDSPLVSRADGWMVATLLAEAVQLTILCVMVRRQGLKIGRRDALHPRAVLTHVRAGLLISLLVLLSQTGPLGLTLTRWFVQPTDLGVYTIALRVSQLILFPLIGAWQLVIPLTSKYYQPDMVVSARQEVRMILISANGMMLLSNLVFLVTGSWLLNVAMNVSDPRAFLCTVILGAGNLIVGAFGVGDQILVARGQHRRAFKISAWSGGIVFLILAGLGLYFGLGIIGIAGATSAAMALRSIVGYIFARRVVDMPIGVFDRH